MLSFKSIIAISEIKASNDHLKFVLDNMPRFGQIKIRESMTHEDERRILESFPEAKIIKVKQDCIIGEHYHKIKTEQFILCEGKCKLIISTIGKLRMTGAQNMRKGQLYIIEPGTYHEFHIEKDSVLIGINSHPYDPTDDYKL